MLVDVNKMPEGPEVYFLEKDLSEYVGLTCHKIKKNKFSKIYKVEIPFLLNGISRHGKVLYWHVGYDDGKNKTGVDSCKKDKVSENGVEDISGKEKFIKFNLGLFGTFSKESNDTKKGHTILKGYSLCFDFGSGKKLYYKDAQNSPRSS